MKRTKNSNHDASATHGPESAAADSGKHNGEPFDAWAIVELMGHRKLAGRVSEQIVAGAPLLRIDVPDSEIGGKKIPGFTTFYGASSIYSLTPTTETICRMYSATHRERPIQAYELRALNPARDLEPDEEMN